MDHLRETITRVIGDGVLREFIVWLSPIDLVWRRHG
jgi:hypothetical protein